VVGVELTPLAPLSRVWSILQKSVSDLLRHLERKNLSPLYLGVEKPKPKGWNLHPSTPSREATGRGERLESLQRYGATRVRKVIPSTPEQRAELGAVLEEIRQGGGFSTPADPEGEALSHCPVCGGADISRWSGRDDVDLECLTPGCLHRWLRSDTQ
jgi:hypothetical protein